MQEEMFRDAVNVGIDQTGGLSWAIFLLIGFLVLLVKFLIAATVWRDADGLKNPRPELAPWLWFLLVLFNSLLGVVAYWLRNHSTLRRRED
jgi:hypothetical protein